MRRQSNNSLEDIFGMFMTAGNLCRLIFPLILGGAAQKVSLDS